MVNGIVSLISFPVFSLLVYRNAISNNMYVLSLFIHVQVFVTLWNVAHRASLSMGFSRQEYCRGLPCPSPGDLPSPGTEPESLKSPALAGGFFTTSTTWETPTNIIILNNDLILHFLLFSTTVFWNPVLLLETSFSSRTHQLKQIYNSPFSQSLLKCQPFPVCFSVFFHQLPTLTSHFLIFVCLFCPASKSKGKKPRDLLMRRGGQRERLVASQWVGSEVGGSQWMSDTVPRSRHTLDKKYWEPFLCQASFWALCTCRWPRPVPALQTLSRKTVWLAEKKTANYNTLRQALFQIWAQNFGVSGWRQGMSSQEVCGRLQSTVIRSYLGRRGHTEGRTVLHPDMWGAWG